jgi:hypothetical protein
MYSWYNEQHLKVDDIFFTGEIRIMKNFQTEMTFFYRRDMYSEKRLKVHVHVVDIFYFLFFLQERYV